MPESTLTHLECPECGRTYNADQVQSICLDCRSPLLARYDLKKAAALTRQEVEELKGEERNEKTNRR